MRILVDADACPVKRQIVQIAKERSLAVVMVCDNAHIINDGYSEVVVVDKGSDSADMALINMCAQEDVVVTQDFGVATMALARKAKAINQNGMIYCDDNIDKLLFERFLGGKVRRSGRKTKGPAKRNKVDDENFVKNLLKLIENR